MSDFNKGDFTQQGVDGHVRATLRLNEKRYVELDLTTNENARGCTISGNVHDRLNNLDYPIGAAPSGNIAITENTAEGEPLDVSQYATATVNVSGGGGGFPTCEITLVPHEGGSPFAGYNAQSPNFCLDANGKLMANIDYQTNLVVNALYAPVGGVTVVTYNNMNQYLSEADALASVTDKVNITAVAYENDGRYFVGIMPTNDTLPSSCTMIGDEKK